jgi:REP element-mobilizing transposase RayT
MSRPLRVEFAGAVYHVTARGNEKRTIFRDNRDHRRFERLLGELLGRFRVAIHAYVLMKNHYHLLLETPEANLSKSMHYLNTAYTSYFNVRHSRVGHLFQGRYKAILVEKENYLLMLSRYIHLNPYRAGIVGNLEAYTWSSYPGYVNQVKQKDWVDYDWILARFDEDLNNARRSYKKFMFEGLAEKIENPLSQVQKGFLLGSDRFVARIAELVEGKAHREVPDSRRFGKAVSAEKVIKVVGRYFNKEESALTRRGSRGNLARRIAIYLTRQYTGEENSTIAKHFNIGYTAVSQVASRLKRAIEDDSQLRRTVQELEARLK